MKIFHTDMFLDHPNKNILMLLYRDQQIDNKKNEMFVHQVHVEQHEIFQVNNHRLSLKINQTIVEYIRSEDLPPTIRPASVKFN